MFSVFSSPLLPLKEPKLVRVATPADYPAVIEVFHSAKDALKLIGIDQWQLGVPSTQHFEADIAAHKGRVCEVDGNIAAYCALSDTPSTFYPQVAGPGWTYPEAPYIQVNRLAVHQNYARQGLAGKLLGFALAEAQRINHQQSLETDNSSLIAPWHVRLDTHPGNVRMHRLLENLGFTRVGTVNYPMPGETTRVCYEGFPLLDPLSLEALPLNTPVTARPLSK